MIGNYAILDYFNATVKGGVVGWSLHRRLKGAEKATSRHLAH